MKKLLAALVLGLAVFASGCTTTAMHRIVYRPIVGSAPRVVRAALFLGGP